MHHLGGQIIERARPLLDLVAVAREGGLADDHGVRLVGAVPVLAHVKCLGRADEQLGGVGLWIDMQDGDFR